MTKKNIVEAFGTGSNVTTPSGLPTELEVLITDYTDLSSPNFNRPQPWIVSFLKRWSNVFTVANRTTNTDETITCTNDGDALRTEGSTTYRVTTFRIQIFRVESAPTIDPDDY